MAILASIIFLELYRFTLRRPPELSTSGSESPDEFTSLYQYVIYL